MGLMAFQGAIFDVDGVLVDSPHEAAWREALEERCWRADWWEIRGRTSWTAERFYDPGVPASTGRQATVGGCSGRA